MFLLQNILFSFSCFWDTFNRTLLQMKQEDPRGVSPVEKKFSTTVYDRMLRGRQPWNQAEYMYLAGVGGGGGVWGGAGVVKKGSGVWLFSGSSSLRASNSWNQTSLCINTLLSTWMRATMRTPTSHLHGTQWCWECDVHRDSTVRRAVLSSPHQSCSATLVVAETTPAKRKKKKLKEGLIFDRRLSSRDHERLALDPPSEVNSMWCTLIRCSDVVWTTACT